MKIIKGLIGFALFAVGTLFLVAYILASAGVNFKYRGHSNISVISLCWCGKIRLQYIY